VFIACKATVDNKISIKTVAEELDIPTPYLGKILQKLTKHNLIQSVKGPNGGFYLSQKGANITLIQIIEVMDGLEFFTSCGLGMKECSDTHPCPLHDDYKVFKDHLQGLFQRKTVADFVGAVQGGGSFIKNLSFVE
jgi:Rrf2 family protein